MPTRSPSQADMLSKWRDAGLRDTYVSRPGRVVKYDAATQLADVKPEIQELFPDEDDNFSNISLPVITNVPVLWTAGGGFGVTCPLAVGDKVALLVSDRSLDAWLAQGGEQAPSDLRRHNLSDCVALVGLHDNQNAIPAVPTDGIALGKFGGMRVKVTTSEVQLGQSATQKAVNGDAYRSAEDTMLTALSAALTAIAAAIDSTAHITALGGAAATACGTAVTAVTTFKAAASGYLSNTVKVQP